MLEAEWTASLLAKVYPGLSRYLIKEFLQAVTELTIVVILALLVTFGAENFVKGPVLLLTERLQNLRLDEHLTLIAITHGNLGGLMSLTHLNPETHLNPYLLQQNRFGTVEDETIKREEDVRRHAGGMPLLTDLSLAKRTDPLALIKGTMEFVTVIYGPAVTFAFPDIRVEAYRRSMMHLNSISAVDGSALSWLRELMSKNLLFAKISELEMTAISFDDDFRDRMGKVDRGLIEMFPKIWILRPYNTTNGEITRILRLLASFHKKREETKLPEEIRELP